MKYFVACLISDHGLFYFIFIRQFEEQIKSQMLVFRAEKLKIIGVDFFLFLVFVEIQFSTDLKI